MKTDKVVQFKDWRCNVHLEQYVDGGTAIILRNADMSVESDFVVYPDTEDIAVATVKIPGIILPDNEVAIKDYSENEGMLKALILADIIAMPHRFVRQGFADIPISKLKIKKEHYEKKQSMNPVIVTSQDSNCRFKDNRCITASIFVPEDKIQVIFDYSQERKIIFNYGPSMAPQQSITFEVNDFVRKYFPDLFPDLPF